MKTKLLDFRSDRDRALLNLCIFRNFYLPITMYFILFCFKNKANSDYF